MEKIVCLLLIALCGINAAPADELEAQSITSRNSNVVAIHLVANDGEFPYMVSLQRRFEPGQRGHVCGGTLISLRHVLIAASCLYETVSGTPMLINPAYYRVFGGHHRLGNNMNDPSRVRMIESFTIHPEFVGGKRHLNDIAIITLNAPFVANTRLQPLALPAQDEQPIVDETCTVPGWGLKTSNDNLMQNGLTYSTQVVARDQAACVSQYTEMFGIPTAVNANMVCASGTRDLTYGCPGDEGAPLVCGRFSNNRRLVGILFTSVRCGISTDPLLYTRVSPYANWARSIIG